MENAKGAWESDEQSAYSTSVKYLQNETWYFWGPLHKPREEEIKEEERVVRKREKTKKRN